MRNRITSVKPWPQGDPSQRLYDGLISAVGYEQRARFLPGVFSPQSRFSAAVAFDNRKVLGYQANLDWFSEHDFCIEEVADNDFGVWCEKFIEKLEPESNSPLKVCVDISSMSRLRIALIVASFLNHNRDQTIEVDLLYAPAEFSAPQIQDGPIVISKPVTDLFAGWTNEPETPPMTIFGLGYERDRAVGVMEYIEPISVWAFKPEGEDRRYDAEIKRANKNFWEVLPKEHLVPYTVARPFDCFTSLEALVFGCRDSARPILIPFGPKVFALCCLLVASVHFPWVAVWRVSGDQFEDPQDRIANGKIIGLRAEFSSDSVALVN